MLNGLAKYLMIKLIRNVFFNQIPKGKSYLRYTLQALDKTLQLTALYSRAKLLVVL